MRCRLFSILLVLFITSFAHSAPLPKDPVKGMPHLVWQVKPIDGIIEDYRHIQAKMKGIEPFAEWEQIEKILKGIFPDWRKAVDSTMPHGGYLTVTDDIEKSRPVFLFPVKEKGAFVELVKFICGGDLAEVEDKPGLYKAGFKFILSKTELSFRFKDDYAYMSFFETDPIDDVRKLPKPTDLLLKDETALLAFRLYLEGVSPESKKLVRDYLETFSNEGHVGVPEMLLMGMIGASDSKDFVNRVRSAVDESKWAALRFEFDKKSDQFALEFNLVPRKETALGKDIAAFKPRPSRFAALLDDQTAAGVLFGYGNFGGLKLDPRFLDEFTKEALDGVGLGDGGEVSRRLLNRALLNSIRVNEVDLAAALKKAPGKDTYTLVVGAKLNQPKLLAAAMFAYFQTLPKEKRESLKMNAMKLDGEIAVHQIRLADLPEPAKKVFGETDLYFCHKDDIMFAAIGTGAVDRLKECLKLEPKEGPQFLIEMDHAKLANLVRAIDEPSAERWAKLFPKEERAKMLHGKVEGGDVLRVRYTADAIPLMKMMLGIR